MDKVRPWCGQPSDRGRLRTEQNSSLITNHKFVHNHFSYRGHRQTHRQTNADEDIFPRFRGDKKPAHLMLASSNTADIVAFTCALCVNIHRRSLAYNVRLVNVLYSIDLS